MDLRLCIQATEEHAYTNLASLGLSHFKMGLNWGVVSLSNRVRERQPYQSFTRFDVG